MERIIFSGGDMDGKTEDFEVKENRLHFDGSGGRGFPRGTYEKSNETQIVNGALRTVWKLVS